MVAVWRSHLLEAQYFLESDMLNLPLLEEPKELLEYRVREFLVELRPAMVAGYAVLTEMPIDDAFNQRKHGFSRGELDRSVQVCLAEIEKLNELAKFSGLLCLARRGTEPKHLEWLKQAQEMAEELLEGESLEFISDLFLYKLGNGFADLNDHEASIASYEKAIEIKPDKHEAWSNRGVSLDDLGRKEEAIESYDKAIEFKPDKHEAWNNRGSSLSALGRNKEAIASFDKAIEFKPDYHKAWFNRGNSLSDLGRKEEAIDSYDKAIDLKPDYSEAWDNRGYALLCLERYQDAIESYDKAIEFKPDYANAFYNRACCHSLIGNLEVALEDLTIAFRLEPEACRQLATTDSDLDPLRSHAPFITLMESTI